jgi:ComF family protein
MRALAHPARQLFASALAPQCAACGAPVPPLNAFCLACACTAQPLRQSAERGTAAFLFGGAIARAICRLKLDRRAEVARPLGDLLSRALLGRPRAAGPTVAVPVPLHPRRLAERGFNQSCLIAGRVAQQLGLPLWPSALVRIRDTVPQATLLREARLANVLQAFAARHPENVCGKSVVLVDDVWTTGATLEACERALRAAGASEVCWAVVARAGY